MFTTNVQPGAQCEQTNATKHSPIYFGGILFERAFVLDVELYNLDSVAAAFVIHVVQQLFFLLLQMFLFEHSQVEIKNLIKKNFFFFFFTNSQRHLKII